ncbi:hypothetical protein ACFL5Y_03355 [Candidatus Omnitrophota bacterium]
MKRIFLVTLLVIAIGFSGSAAAQLKKPRITPMEGQTKAQQAKDTQECRILAIKKTGVDPDALEVNMSFLGSQYSQASIPRGDSLTMHPGQNKKAQKSVDQAKELKKENEKYLQAFSEAMEERGYKVK